MKQKISRLEEVQSGASELKKMLLYLDEQSVETDAKLQKMLIRSSELSSNQDNGYIRERIKRFHSLLQKHQQRLQDDARSRSLLHRQIDRLLDADLIQYYAPAVDKRISSLSSLDVTEKQDQVLLHSELKNLHRRKVVLYEFDGMQFLVIGLILKTGSGRPAAPPRVYADNQTVQFFPYTEEHRRTEKTGLAVIKGKGSTIALWVDRLIEIYDYESVMKDDVDHPLQHALRSSLEGAGEHRFVQGKFRYRGRHSFLLSF